MERLDAGEVVIGDGSYVFTLEKRGYVQAGKYTPEAACEHPEAVRQLALEFARAGGDVTQTFTYGSTEGEIMLIIIFMMMMMTYGHTDIRTYGLTDQQRVRLC